VAELGSPTDERGIHVSPYLVMLYAGIVTGILLATQWAGAHGLPAGRVNAALLCLLLPALVGARLLFVATHWKSFRIEPRRIFRRANSGGSLFGGLILAVVLSVPLLRGLGIAFLGFWDAATMAMLAGMIFGKAGCLLTGCCAGRPANGRFALWLPGRDGRWQRRVPTQVLEAVLAALLLGGSGWLRDCLPFQGSLFLFALGSYSLGRWCLEPARETVDRAGSVNVIRAISGALAGLAAAGFVAAWLLRR
jgi:phosphatidylglycerol:prolipoprotein diacylglycerol transferase